MDVLFYFIDEDYINGAIVTAQNGNVSKNGLIKQSYIVFSRLKLKRLYSYDFLRHGRSARPSPQPAAENNINY